MKRGAHPRLGEALRPNGLAIDQIDGCNAWVRTHRLQAGTFDLAPGPSMMNVAAAQPNAAANRCCPVDRKCRP
jgi:hypothetical protein